MSEWQPDPNGVAQVLELATMALTPTSYHQTLARLTEFNQSPEFNMYLCFAYVHCDSASLEVRMMISIILKGNVARYWSTMPDEVKQYIMANVPNMLAHQHRHLREACATLISVILAQTSLLGWPNLVENLVASLDSDNEQLAHGAFTTLLRVCEDHGRALSKAYPELPHQPIDSLVPKLLEIMAAGKEFGIDMSLKCFTHLIPWKPSAFLTRIKDFFQLLFALAENPPSLPILVAVCKTFDALVHGRISAIVDYMNDVIQYMLTMTNSEHAQVALAASNFWSTIADTEICYQAVAPHLTQVVETLLRHMRYSEDELAQLPEVEEDLDLPDKPENTAPATGKLSMAETDTEAAYDTSLSVSEWTLRKSCGQGLEDLTNVFSEELLEIIIPLCEAGLQSPDWLDRESCILALGATSTCFLDCGTEHLGGLVPMLLSLLDDPRAVIRHVAAWAISRYSRFIVAHDDMLQPTIFALSRRLHDRSKTVLEWTLQTLAILSEAALETMCYYLEDLLPVFMELYQHLQGRPLAKLHDAIGALSEAVGEALNQPHLIGMLVPPLMARWDSYEDTDEKAFPLFDCVTRVTLGLGASFAPFAAHVWDKCVRLIQSYLMESALAKQNPSHDEPNPKFAVCALELISAIVESLKAGSADLITESNLCPLLVEIADDQSIPMTRANFLLIGNIASTCFGLIAPALNQLMPVLVSNIRPRVQHTSISLNSSWAVQQFITRAGDAMAPYAEEITRRCVNIILDPHIHHQFLVNTAILLSGVAQNFPQVIAVDLQNFIAPWCYYLGSMEEDDEKKTSFFGLLDAVRANPEAVLHHFHAFANAIASWGVPPNSLKSAISEIFLAYQQQLGPEVWQQVLKTVLEEDLEILQRWYPLS